MNALKSSGFNLHSIGKDEWYSLFYWQKYIAIREHYGMELKMPIDGESFPLFLAKINEIRVSLGKTKINCWTAGEGMNSIFLDL
jgi:hypothetical protein